MTNKKYDVEAKALIRGMALCAGWLAEEKDVPSVAADMLRSHGITMADFVKAGTDEYDMERLRRLYATDPF